MKFKAFKNKCALIEKRLNKLLDSVKTFSEEESLDSRQIHRVKSIYDEAKTKHDDVYSSLDVLFDDTNAETDEAELEIITSRIFDLFIEIEVLVKPLILNNPIVSPSSKENVSFSDQSDSANGSNKPSHIKLPKLQLKYFDGDISQWTAYYNLFNTSVHNNSSLSEVEKFQFLLSTLSKEPLNLIKSLPLTADNYKIAYDILVKRYQNPRLLKSVHVNFLIDMPDCKDLSAMNLRNFISQYNEHSSALTALNYDMESENPFLITLLMRKFDHTLRTQFEGKRERSDDFPTSKEFISFLENECIIKENALLSQDRTHTTKHHNFVGQHTKESKQVTHFSNVYQTNNSDMICIYCNNTGHTFFRCNGFLNLSPKERFEFIKLQNLCVNCLRSHKTSQCTSKKTCNYCGKKHNSLLHLDTTQIDKFNSNNTTNKQSVNSAEGNQTTDFRNSSSRSPPIHSQHRFSTAKTHFNNPSKVKSHEEPPPDNKQSTHSIHTTRHSSSTSYTTLLATAMVKLSFSNGHQLVARALIDSGSSCSIIDEQIASQLAVKRNFSQKVSHLNGISSVPVQTKGQTSINIFSMNDEVIARNHPVLILNKITSNMPCTNISQEVVQKLKNFKLADPTFHKPGPIQVLIGADLFLSILRGTIHRLGENMPCAVDSVLGFIIMGQAPVSDSSDEAKTSSSLITLLTLTEDPLHKTMTKFWELEQPNFSKHINPDDIECENYFHDTYVRNKQGKYTVSLPFKENPAVALGQSSETAKKRFFSLEKRLDSQPEYKTLYNEFMNDYLKSGHMKLYDIASQGHVLPSPHYFLPHHGVFKKNSSTTKLRVVFDASTLTSTGKSLNDILHVGPKLHNDIASIILNFRRYNYVFTTDIKQMFRSIDLHPADHQFQMIYWREDISQPLSIYKLQTVTYGMTSSPFLANRTILQLIEDEGNNHLMASKALRSQIYVDDIVLGADTLNEAVLLQNDVNELFQKGGFHLRKWTSNHEDLLKNIPKEFHENPVHFRTPDQPLVSVLGMQWLPTRDSFSYRIQVTSDSDVHTKRTVLQNISSIYDPCGFLAPVVFFAKEFIQQLWLAGIHWDTPLPSNLSKVWDRFILDLPKLESIVFERSLLISSATNIQLHGFSDASPKGMAASVYIRTVNPEGKVNVSLLIAKTRVAPLKHTSLPRLELSAAYLLSDLLDFCVKKLEILSSVESITAWSDSSVTLSWIRTPSHRLKLYVANRVSHIQEIMPPELWRYVPSAQNPADSATRGLYPSQLLTNTSWLKGPSWLYSSPDNWPQMKPVIDEKDIPEIKSNPLNTCAIVEEQKFDLLHRFSSWSKLLRVTTYVLRFIRNLKSQDKSKSFFKSSELESSEKLIIQQVQNDSFSTDIFCIKNEKPISQRLLRLSPFLDDDGLLRVGGRLKYAPVHYEVKHPLILPKNHHVTNLIIDYFHKKHLHAGPYLLHSIISQKYWILSARSVIRSRIFKCLICYRYRPKLMEPKMGNIPEARLTPSPPFKTTGCDYAGPFDVKIHTLRRAQVIKAYICLFICFVTKAVHIEVTTDLTANSYLAALTRFVSRRGLVSHLYLDNATNFVGVSNILKRTVKDLLNDPETNNSLYRFSLENSVTFHFIPPRASHMGGLWERTIRSIKTHLYKIVGQQILTLQEFQTLAVRIEGILNSRPLSPLSSDPNELDVLTPGHFLIGRPLIALPEKNMTECNMNHLKRWQRVQAITQQLWTRWQKEILNQMQQRAKWNKSQPNLKIGDIVIIHEENTPPQKWCLGRITETIQGTDGIVRVVHMKTATGNLTRPVVKVSPLPHCSSL